MEMKNFTELTGIIAELKVPIVIFKGYHLEELFPFGVCDKIERLNIPNIKTVKLTGIPKDSDTRQAEDEIISTKKKLGEAVYIDLHEGSFDPTVFPSNEKAFVWLQEDLLSWGSYLERYFHVGEVKFYSHYEGATTDITSIEFFPQVCTLEEGCLILLNLIVGLSKVYHSMHTNKDE